MGSKAVSLSARKLTAFTLLPNCWRIQLRLGESGLLQEMGGDGSDPSEIRGPYYVDPLNPQTKYSSALQDLFRFAFNRGITSTGSSDITECPATPSAENTAAALLRQPSASKTGGSACAIPSVAVGIFAKFRGRRLHHSETVWPTELF